MNVRKAAGVVGAILVFVHTVVTSAERIVGWASLPSDLRTWRSFLGAVFGAAPLLDWAILAVGAACLALALGWQPWTHLQRRDVAADNSFAEKCEDLARELLEQYAAAQRVKTDRHYAVSLHASTSDAWLEARQLEARDDEEIAKRFGRRIHVILAEIQRRGVKLDLFAVEIKGQYLEIWARGMMLLAGAFRAGDYAGKTLGLNFHDATLQERANDHPKR